MHLTTEDKAHGPIMALCYVSVWSALKTAVQNTWKWMNACDILPVIQT